MKLLYQTNRKRFDNLKVFQTFNLPTSTTMSATDRVSKILKDVDTNRIPPTCTRSSIIVVESDVSPSKSKSRFTKEPTEKSVDTSTQMWYPTDSVKVSTESPKKRSRGRPKGSKDKTKRKSRSTKEPVIPATVEVSTEESAKRGRGRPKGSKSKSPSNPRRCRQCGQTGHNERTCDQRGPW